MNKILFIKEFRIGLNKMSWGLPGGFIEKNEKPKKAAIRELFEETGIYTNDIKFFKKYVRNGNYHGGTDYIYFTKVKKKKIKLEKNVKHKWLNKIEILDYLKNNKFKTPGIIATAFYFIIR